MSTYGKMHRFASGERQFVLLSAGNLATTQGVVAQLQRDMKHSQPRNLATVTDMADAADYVGELSLAQQRKHGNDIAFEASFIIGGQIPDEPPAAFLVYPQGNHITTSADTPYLQIGESKYGKPMLDRLGRGNVSLEDAARLAVISLEATIRSNLTVGPPIDLALMRADTYTLAHELRLGEESDFFRETRKRWQVGIEAAFLTLPRFEWESGHKKPT